MLIFSVRARFQQEVLWVTVSTRLCPAIQPENQTLQGSTLHVVPATLHFRADLQRPSQVSAAGLMEHRPNKAVPSDSAGKTRLRKEARYTRQTQAANVTQLGQTELQTETSRDNLLSSRAFVNTTIS